MHASTSFAWLVAISAVWGCDASTPEGDSLEGSSSPVSTITFGNAASTSSGTSPEVSSTGRPSASSSSSTTEPVVPETPIAPADIEPDALALADGDTPVLIVAGGVLVYRVDASEKEHVAFRLELPAWFPGVAMQVDRWDGKSVVPLGMTDSGVGVRTLAVLDETGPRTYWVRISSTVKDLKGTLVTTRTPFETGLTCTEDCARLMQLPLPNDSEQDGYAFDAGTVFQYQFGRRDLVMFLRATAKQMRAAKYVPFFPYDLSQWDGKTPGVDVGVPRHLSHKNGKDVDVSLYGTDGQAFWRSFCDVTTTADGRECKAGTVEGFDGFANARLIGHFFSSKRVDVCFLDRRLIDFVEDGALAAYDQDLVSSDILPLFSDGHHLEHWPNHDNHVHVRVLDTKYVALSSPLWQPAAVDAP